MYKLFLRITALVLVFMLGINGCSLVSTSTEDSDSNESLVKDNVIEVIPGNGIAIYNVKLTELSGRAIITGSVRTNSMRRGLTGHVDIKIESTRGETLQKLSTLLDLHITHRHHRSGHPEFRIALDEPVPIDAKIIVSYHVKSVSTKENAACANLHCQ